MQRVFAPFLWIYDFLAEDPTLVVGTALAIILAVILVHVARPAAGVVLFLAVVAVIAASVWLTVRSPA